MRFSHYIGSFYRLIGKIVPAADLRCQEKWPFVAEIEPLRVINMRLHM
jgi:hypothetical protein